MKRQLTLPIITMIFKPICIGVLLLLATAQRTNAFFPTTPDQLTVLTENNQHYQAECPQLTNASIISREEALSHTFTLLNWNIYKQQKTSWESSLIEWANKADFITLQEAKLSPELISFSHSRQLFYLQNYAFKHDDSIYGVNTLSKIAPLELCGTAYNEPWIWIPKTGIASTYPIKKSNQSLLLINLHGVNFTLTEQPLREQLTPYFELIRLHQGPIIFSGDFNTWSDARLLGVKEALINTGFSETLFNNDNRLTVLGLPLDHVYFRGLKVIEAKSIATEASDHSPQLVTFEIE